MTPLPITTDSTSFLFETMLPNVKPQRPEQVATTIILLPKTYIAKSAITKAEGYFLIVGLRGQACAVEIDAKALTWLVNDVANSPIIAAKKAVLALAATEKDLNSRGLSIFSVHRVLNVDGACQNG